MKIIAEAGSNHNGSLELAKKLIDVALNAKADVVKFQFIFPEGLYLEKYYDRGTYVENPVFKQRQKETLTPAQWGEVWQYAKDKNIEVTASVFCDAGLELLQSLGADLVKISSSDIDNLSLIRKCAESFETLIISTGMATIQEVIQAYQTAKAANDNINLVVMHCVSLYPCAIESAGLGRIPVFQGLLDCEIGYSDHTLENASAISALTLGCQWFEKHYTLDKNLPGFDHAHAQSECELTNYVTELTHINTALSKYVGLTAKPTDGITAVRARRGLYAAKDIESGCILTEADIIAVRPASEMTPAQLSALVGQKVSAPIKKYQSLKPQMDITPGSSDTSNARNYWRDEMSQKGIDK